MFWEKIKAKGKVRLTIIAALCAVFIGCTAFAFSNLFGETGLTGQQITASASTGDIGKGDITLTDAERAEWQAGDGTKAKPYIITVNNEWLGHHRGRILHR